MGLATSKLNSTIISIENRQNNLTVKTSDKPYQADIIINTLPPRLAIKNINYRPELPRDLVQKLSTIPTWMGASAKYTIEFETPFWRDQGLNGFGFSHVGPLGEIHDTCVEGKAALFGFFHAQTKEKCPEAVKAQMIRLFGEDAKQIKNIHITDWTQEQYSSVSEDHKPKV